MPRLEGPLRPSTHPVIAARCKELGLSVQDLADRSGLSLRFTYRLVGRTARLNVVTARAIGAALDLNPRELLIEQIDYEMEAEA